MCFACLYSCGQLFLRARLVVFTCVSIVSTCVLSCFHMCFTCFYLFTQLFLLVFELLLLGFPLGFLGVGTGVAVLAPVPERAPGAELGTDFGSALWRIGVAVSSRSGVGEILLRFPFHCLRSKVVDSSELGV